MNDIFIICFLYEKKLLASWNIQSILSEGEQEENS